MRLLPWLKRRAVKGGRRASDSFVLEEKCYFCHRRLLLRFETLLRSHLKLKKVVFEFDLIDVREKQPRCECNVLIRRKACSDVVLL